MLRVGPIGAGRVTRNYAAAAEMLQAEKLVRLGAAYGLAILCQQEAYRLADWRPG
jgi:hypothetical protein